MKHFNNLFKAVLLLPLLTACIENNVPYPVVEVAVLKVEGEGFTVGSNDIDSKNRVVTLRLDEPTDISKVHITNVAITEGGHSVEPLTGTFDLRAPRTVTLSLYQNYSWSFVADQQIARSFKVEGQIGDTEFDLAALTATVRVPVTADLKHIKVTELKLGPKDITTMDPKMEELTDFASVRYVDVNYHDVHERWRLYVERSDERISLEQIDLWANTATVTGIVTETEYPDAELQYRLLGSEQWQTTTKGEYAAGVFSATIVPSWKSATNGWDNPIYTLDNAQGIFAGRTYELQLLIKGQQVTQREVTAPEGDKIPDGDMENSALSCFTSDNATSTFWGSGNNTFASGLCKQSTYAGMQGSFCAKLTGTSAAGVLASGNLFSGTFYKDGLTKGVVEFGQPYNWTARPSAVKLKYYAEKIGIVDIAMHSGAPIKKGDQDKSRIFVAIVDWGSRHVVASGTAAPTGTWDPEQITSTGEGRIIAYGSIFIEQASTGGSMIDLTLPLNFYDKEVKPSGKYSLVISCSTSAYGDFMVGCKSNVLFVDDFQWVY